MELGNWRTRDEVRCLYKASSSLKTPTIPSFYMIITHNQSTKLVFNLVYRKGSGSWLERRCYWSRLSAMIGCLLVGGADARGLGCCAPDLGSGIGGGATVYTQILNPDISKTW